MSYKVTDTMEIAPGVQMPRIGFGVYKSAPEVCVKSCLEAYSAGYRHFDSAMYYANEKQVGEAVQQMGCNRADVFVTTKFFSVADSLEETYKTVVDAVDKFDLGFVDLFLIHTPNVGGPEKRKIAWQALEKLLEAKKTRSIGVSNYGEGHLKELAEYAKVKPAVNQIELHPWCQSKKHVKYCEEQGIPLQAYCPIVRAQKNDHPLVKKLAEKYGKDPAQILIRWSLQKGYVPLPKSDTPSRIRSNIDVFDFSLDEEDMKELDAQDEGQKGAIAPYNLECK